MTASNEGVTFPRDARVRPVLFTARKWSPRADWSRSIRRAIWPRSPAFAGRSADRLDFDHRQSGRRANASARLARRTRGRSPRPRRLHLTCKDMNRNGLESAAWRYASEGFENILAITGDYPTGGFGSRAEPVFDLDSVGLITLLRSMNEGLSVLGRGGKPETLPKTNFFIGCVVSPFKRHERELMPQYFKLVRKIAAGAQWVIPQLGYDMRKFHEVKLLLDARGINVPVIGNVYLLTKGVAKLFNSGKLAGCVVSDKLLETIEKYAAGPGQGQEVLPGVGRQAVGRVQGAGLRRRLSRRHPQGRGLRPDHRLGRELWARRLEASSSRKFSSPSPTSSSSSSTISRPA